MYNLIYTMQADMYAFIVLIIIYVNMLKRADGKDLSNRLFLLQVKITAAALTFDMAMVRLDGVPGMPVHWTLILFSTLFYILNPITGVIWVAYVDNFIYHDKARFKQYAFPVLAPAVLNGILAIISSFGGYLFCIHSNNVYQSGPLFFVMVIINYFYILLATIHILHNREKIPDYHLLPLLFFAVPPTIGGILQILFYGTSLMWPLLTISLLIVFVYVQLTLMNKDHLTGLFNRREFDFHVFQAERSHHSSKQYVAGAMLDLDFFKQINDTYGHPSGDRALRDISNLLRSSFRPSDFIARIGGDEFALILKVSSDAELEDLIHGLERNLSDFNSLGNEPYHLSVSIGYGLYTPETVPTLVEFFQHLDSRMYEAKRIKKQNQNVAGKILPGSPEGNFGTN